MSEFRDQGNPHRLYRNPAIVRNYWKLVERHRITILSAVPTVLSALAAVPLDGADIFRFHPLINAKERFIEKLRAAEAAGLKEITLLPPMDHARRVFRDFATHVIARY